MASTRKLIVADTWTEVLGAGALGIITVLQGTIVVNRSASIPTTDDGQVIGDMSSDKAYERGAESDSTLKLWAKAIGSSGKAEILIDEGLNSTGDGATVDISSLEASVNATKTALIAAVNTAISEMAGNVSPFGDLRCFTTAGGQPTWFFGIPRMTWEQLRPDGLLGTGTHEAFIDAGVEKSTLWIAAYPASMVDGEIVSQPGVMPRTGRTFDEEIAECANTEIIGHEGKHRLMSAWDWSLLMHLAIVSGYQPLGNTNYGKSHVNPWLSGRGTAVTATGSLGKASAHNNSNAGIFDLVGNVWERLQGMYLQDGQIHLAADNGSAAVATGYYFSSSSATASGTPSLVSSAASVVRNGPIGDDSHNLYDAIGGASGFASLTGTGTIALKRAGIIPVNSATAPAGAIWTRSYGRRAPLRGASWSDGSGSGLGALNLTYAPSSRRSLVGFRPAFVA